MHRGRRVHALAAGGPPPVPGFWAPRTAGLPSGWIWEQDSRPYFPWSSISTGEKPA